MSEVAYRMGASLWPVRCRIEDSGEDGSRRMGCGCFQWVGESSSSKERTFRERGRTAVSMEGAVKLQPERGLS